MARTTDYTVAYSNGETNVDLFKIVFGGDGSYYLTAPYHPLNRAIAARFTVNYAGRDGVLDLNSSQELAVVDDEDGRLKVSHHPDGFLQFPGVGIRSGRRSDGTPKGIGVFSWPLQRPTFGPSFSLAFSDPVACGRPSAYKKRTLVFHEEDIEHMRRDLLGLRFTGYYFPTPWREFVYRGADGEMWIDLVQPPAQAVRRLRVVLASMDCDIKGFIGLEAFPHGMEDRPDGTPSFAVSTSTGNLRRNENGDLLGDQLLCVYPMPELNTINLQTLNTPPLPAPPYTAPPGTTAVHSEEEG